MGDWANLPSELLHFICQRLTTSIDILRFRSICATWRSVAPLQSAVSSRCPIVPNSGISATTWGFYLSRRNVYSIQSTLPHHHLSWIVKLESDNWNQMHLLNPLTRSQFRPLPNNFPKFFSFLDFRVKELGQEYALQYIDYRPMANSIGEAGNLYMEKVAVFLDVNNNGFLLLTIHLSGKLVVYRSGDEKWMGISNDSPSPYDDVIFRQGKFYAVDITGRVVVVNCEELSAEAVASSIFGGDKKFLLDSNGELLLVDMYLSDVAEDDSVVDDLFEFHEDSDYFVSERAFKFKVFRLDDNAGKWVEVNDLGDRILFLGENSTFSISASEVSGDDNCKGNCILFTNQCGGRVEDEVWKSRVAGVFYLEKGSIEPISSLSDYCKMFWPPPDWVCLSMAIEDEVNQLNI